MKRQKSVFCAGIAIFAAFGVCVGNSAASNAAETDAAAVVALPAASGEAGERTVLNLCGVDFAMRRVPAGKFQMGSPEDEDGRESVEILHEVELTRDFLILETEVTQAMWKSVCGDNPSKFQGENRPVDTVGIAEIEAFCEKLTAELRQLGPDWANVRAALPTEAQWEYAARAGNAGPFSGSSLEEIAWFGDENDGGTRDVATKKPNAWGIYDMSGNLWEWCADRYGDYKTDADGKGLAATDPTGATPEECPGDIRVDRGGCWDSQERECRNANRGFYDGDRKGPYVGFRFVINFE